MTMIAANASAGALHLLAQIGLAGTKPKSESNDASEAPDPLFGAVARNALDKRLKELDRDGSASEPVALNDITDILEQSYLGHHILGNVGKESPTRAILFDADGKVIGRILDGGGAHIQSSDAHLFGGRDRFFAAMKPEGGTMARAKALMSIAPPGSRMVFVVDSAKPDSFTDKAVSRPIAPSSGQQVVAGLVEAVSRKGGREKRSQATAEDGRSDPNDAVTLSRQAKAILERIRHRGHHDHGHHDHAHGHGGHDPVLIPILTYNDIGAPRPTAPTSEAFQQAVKTAPFHLIRIASSGEFTIGHRLIDAPGVRKLDADEAARTHLELRNRINLSDETKAKMGLGEILETLEAQDAKHLADTLAASAARSARSRRIRELADQIYAEVHRLKDSHVEPSAFAVISDENGKVVGKVLQGGGVWFDGNEIWRVKDNAALRLLTDEVWKQTDDPKQAQQRLYEGLKELVGARGAVTLTGVNVDPPPFGSELLASLQEEFYGLLGSGSSDATP